MYIVLTIKFTIPDLSKSCAQIFIVDLIWFQKTVYMNYAQLVMEYCYAGVHFDRNFTLPISFGTLIIGLRNYLRVRMCNNTGHELHQKHPSTVTDERLLIRGKPPEQCGVTLRHFLPMPYAYVELNHAIKNKSLNFKFTKL